MMIVQRILFLFLIFLFSSSAFSAKYEIAAQFVSPFSHAGACGHLKVINLINEEMKTANPEKKKELEVMKGDFIKDAEAYLSEWAATVTLSIKLPATLVMNKENFSVKGLEINVFSSEDISYYMDENGVITLAGSGRISLGLDLKVAAFCPYITDENKTPSIETVLAGLIKE